MNRDQHIAIGLVAFAVYVILLNYLKPVQLDSVVYGGIAAVVSSVLPDWIEPARSWKHRAFGHSKRVLRWSLMLFLLSTILTLLYPYGLVISGALLGYASHLLADSTTPVGLPD